MKRLVVLYSLLLFFSARSDQSIVSYDPLQAGCGRLGDKLFLYIKALWISHKYAMPFVYQPFPYSDQLELHDVHFGTVPTSLSGRTIVKEKQTPIYQQAHTLYIIDYYYCSPSWHMFDDMLTWHDLITDTQFIEKLRKLIRPRTAIELLSLPTDSITVAVHIRKGGGADPALFSETIEQYPAGNIPEQLYIDKVKPLHFPPDSYYIEQIQQVAALYPNRKLYVYLFTDDSNPARLYHKYAQAINNPLITWNYRKHGNHHSKYVLEDLFNMMRFDCLIRGQSNYAQIVHLVGDNRLIIYPKHASWHGLQLIIDDVGIINKGL